MRCEDLAMVLPGLLDESTSLDRSGRNHVGRCLRCQAEMAQYRRLARSLRGLRDDVAPAPGLLGEILEALVSGEVPARSTSSVVRRAAYLSGLAAATAAGAAGIVLAANRARSRRLAG